MARCKSALSSVIRLIRWSIYPLNKPILVAVAVFRIEQIGRAADARQQQLWRCPGELAKVTAHVRLIGIA